MEENAQAGEAGRELRMPKIVVLDGYAACPDDPEFACYRVLDEATAVYARTAQEEAAARIGDAQVVLTNKVLITREVMESCPNLRYVGVLATGYNVVDLAAAREHGITVTNVPAYSTQAVAQHVVALLLHELSRVASYDAQVKAGRWSACGDFCFFSDPMEEAAGKRFGIVGFGHIGQAVARAVTGLGMEALVFTPHPPKQAPEGVRFVPLETLFESSDVISLHCPLTERTRALIGVEAIARMKPGVRVINTARGPLVDSRAMAEALSAGKVTCYMADVLESEPPQAEDPLLNAPNTVITPHVAWAPKQTRERLVGIAMENLRAWIDGHPRNVVNP